VHFDPYVSEIVSKELNTESSKQFQQEELALQKSKSGEWAVVNDSLEQDMMLVLTSFKGLIFQNKALEPAAVAHLKRLMQGSQMREGLLEVMAEVGTGMRQIY